MYIFQWGTMAHMQQCCQSNIIYSCLWIGNWIICSFLSLLYNLTVGKFNFEQDGFGYASCVKLKNRLSQECVCRYIRLLIYWNFLVLTFWLVNFSSKTFMKSSLTMFWNYLWNSFYFSYEILFKLLWHVCFDILIYISFNWKSL